jgi:hypothetical protein
MNQQAALQLYSIGDDRPVISDIDQSSQTLSRPDQWRRDLKQHFDEMCDVTELYLSAVGKMQKFTPNVDQLSVFTLVRQQMEDWVKQQCEVQSNLADNVSHAKITVGLLPLDLWKFNFKREHNSSHTIRDLCKEVLEDYDFECLDECLIELGSEIEGSGFKEAANYLVSHLGFRNYSTRSDDVLALKKQKGMLILEMSYYGAYRFERIRYLEELRKFSNTFENESGVSGLADSIQGIIDAENALKSSFDESIPSRTAANVGGPVHAVVFKEKIKFYFSEHVFAALVGFVRSYSTENIVRIDIL